MVGEIYELKNKLLEEMMRDVRNAELNAWTKNA